MERINYTVKLIAADVSEQSTVILCFYTGDLPSDCAPMPRDPAPAVGLPFDERFGIVLADATRLNPAVHDGAIMIGRTTADSPYLISGWSFRLFAQAKILSIETNRGSAFNSCLAMSMVDGVDALYLISKVGAECCVQGRASSYETQYDGLSRLR
ncbi:hypothetical protein ACFIOY_20450 [Bradyrhizobium sp. TZ2]